MKTKLKLAAICYLLSAICVSTHAQGTVFTYQGRLNDGGAPASGKYDFRFRLASDPLGNNYVGSPYLTNGIAVSNGLFIATLDFGPGIFTGSNYWLEVDVRTNGAGGYTALYPLQQFTPTPYAIFANSASNILGTLPAGQLSGTVGAATNFTGNLSGDVTGAQETTVVSFVSGQTAANVAAGASVANAATSTNTPNTIVKRDASGNFSAGNATLAQSLNFVNDSVTPWTFNILTGQFMDSFMVLDQYANLGLGIDTAVASTNGSAAYNTGLGTFALRYFTNGLGNTALGFGALSSLRSGSYNIAIGYDAGVTGGSNNIDIGGFSSVENQTIRIGGSQTNTYIAGIYGATVSDGVQVYVDSSRRLGVLSSSQKYKQDIQPMADASGVLLSLQPVMFKYKSGIDPTGTPQFGLVAEQVEKVAPDLVVHDPQHGIYTVRYQAVDAMLLNEFLKEHRTVEKQTRTVQEQSAEIQDLKQRLEALEKIVLNQKSN